MPAFAVILVTLTLDAMGVGLILPILPSLLRELDHTGDIAFEFGLLIAAYAAMQFVFAPILGALADRWDELAAGRLFPELTELKGVDGVHDPRQLVVWDVEGQGRLRKFRALYQGEQIAEVFGSDWTRQNHGDGGADVVAHGIAGGSEGMRRQRLPRLYDPVHFRCR